MAAPTARACAILAAMHHRRLAGQVLCAGYPAEGPASLLELIEDDALAGVILFARNITEPIAVAREIATIADASPRTPLVAVDQEGGRVQRFRSRVLQLPPMRHLGERGDVAFTERAAAALGAQLGHIGFNVDFAPVLDVDTNPANSVIGDRSFSSDPEVVAAHGLAFARGLQSAGLLACGKHFPGHGDTLEDSHFDLPALKHDMARLEAVELVPFRAAVGQIGSLMTAHIVFEALDPSCPATLSRAVITGLLREQVGYEGLVVSDDLEMKAIADHYGTGEAAVGAIAAGCDLLLVCKTLDRVHEARDALAKEASRSSAFAARLTDAAERVNRARATLKCAPMSSPDLLDGALDVDEVKAVEALLGTTR